MSIVVLFVIPAFGGVLFPCVTLECVKETLLSEHAGAALSATLAPPA